MDVLLKSRTYDVLKRDCSINRLSWQIYSSSVQFRENFYRHFLSFLPVISEINSILLYFWFFFISYFFIINESLLDTILFSLLFLIYFNKYFNNNFWQPRAASFYFEETKSESSPVGALEMKRKLTNRIFWWIFEDDKRKFEADKIKNKWTPLTVQLL